MMTIFASQPTSAIVWLVLFGSFGLGYWYRRRRWRHRHDVLEEYVAGPKRKEAHHALPQ
jgi:hypothetical protein